MAAAKQPNGRNKWDNTIPVQAFILIKDTGNEVQTAAMLGVRHCVFKKWKKLHPELVFAVKEARKIRASTAADTFIDYVYGRLPPKMKKWWDRICSWEKQHRDQKIEAFMVEKGESVQMQFFFYALVNNNFNMMMACRRTRVGMDKLKRWSSKPEFATMMEYIHLAKKDFFESSLIRLVKNGDTGATIFANKTYNRDRGYNEKVEVDVKMNVQHTNLIDITMLDLPIEVKRMILEAIRKSKEQQNIGSQPIAALEYKKVGSKAIPNGEYAEENEDAA